jgi:hypothetical protein
VRDWSTIAKAAGLGIPESEVERIAGPLQRLEEAFRPLVKGLTPDAEPATVFRCEEPEE